MELDACLPPSLRGPQTTISPIASGLSGAAVYRVDANGRTYVLKRADAQADPAVWRGRAAIAQAAADAGLTPAIVHVDDERRAITSAFVIDRSFPAYAMNPQTRADAIAQLGQTLRRVHALPLPADAALDDRSTLLARIAQALAGFAIPAFLADAIRSLLAEEPPPSERAFVLSHNDVNPSNLVYDGERILLLDWDTAGPNDPFYDLAAAALFLRFDDATSAQLIAAYDGEPAAAVLPPRFRYCRRLVGVSCAAIFMHLARAAGHAGQPHGADDTIAAAPALAEIYQQMRAGTFDLASGDGRWALGLALAREALAPPTPRR